MASTYHSAFIAVIKKTFHSKAQQLCFKNHTTKHSQAKLKILTQCFMLKTKIRFNTQPQLSNRVVDCMQSVEVSPALQLL